MHAAAIPSLRLLSPDTILVIPASAFARAGAFFPNPPSAGVKASLDYPNSSMRPSGEPAFG